MVTENIETNYKNINWYAEQLTNVATIYKAHAGKETFVDQTLVQADVKQLRRLARCITQLAKAIESENN